MMHGFLGLSGVDPWVLDARLVYGYISAATSRGLRADMVVEGSLSVTWDRCGRIGKGLRIAVSGSGVLLLGIDDEGTLRWPK